MINILKQKSGITLIALVITIIVLLILAGVSISMLSGDNGILQKATDAKTNTEKEEVYEQISLATASGEMEYYSNGTDRLIAYKNALLNGVDGIDRDNLTDNGSNLITGTVTKKSGKQYDFSVPVPVTDITVDEHEEKEKLIYSINDVFEDSGNTPGKMHIGDYINLPIYYDNVTSTEYNGWRIMSINGTGKNTYLKLISAGVPATYEFYDQNTTKPYLNNWTSNFSPLRDIGFKVSENGSKVSNSTEMLSLFNTNYTSNVGLLTINELNQIWGSNAEIGTSLTSNDLLAVPCYSSGYAVTWIISDGGLLDYDMLFISNNGKLDFNYDSTYGVRFTVALKSDVKFSLSDESKEDDDVKTWDLIASE